MCHSLKNLVEDLADCDSKIDEIKLVMEILGHLPPFYHNIVDVITNTKTFPSFLESKSMFLIHESRKESINLTGDASLTSFVALYSSTSTSGKLKNKFNRGKIMGDLLPKGCGVNSNVSANSNSFSVSQGAQGQNQVLF